LKIEHIIDKLEDAEMALNKTHNHIRKCLQMWVAENYPELEEACFGVVNVADKELTTCFYAYTEEDQIWVELDVDPQRDMIIVTI